MTAIALCAIENPPTRSDAMKYHERIEIENLDRGKAPGLADRKSIHISNINRLTIGQPRGFGTVQIPYFSPLVV